MSTLKAAAATANIPADDDMVIAGGILPAKASAQEAPLRASALVIEADERVCLVSADVLAITRDMADAAAQQIAAACSIPFDNILIAATHTHHAPSTFTVHAYQRDEQFCQRVVAAILEAATQACEDLIAAQAKPNESEAELLFALGQEATVGQNSRWLMDDGQITWYGHDPALMVRPTGPHDPDLPVLALRRPASRGDGPLLGALFCHATHNIGQHRGDVPARSPGFLGLAAQELERQHGAPFVFLPGAFGSSHRLDKPAPQEATVRVVAAVNEAIRRLQPALVGPVVCLKHPFTCTIRAFEEECAAHDVARWCRRWFDPATAEAYESTFRAMRRELGSRANTTFDTWLQVIRLGEVAIVGVPGEMFGALGLEIRRRSPFRHTIVCGLANDEVGYIPDRVAYTLGGYQVWPGFHSLLAPGIGEDMVEAAVDLLNQAHGGPVAGEPTMQRLTVADAAALQRFYNHLPASSRWLFRPLGWNATYHDCLTACQDAAAGKRFDVVLRAGAEIVGWAFLMGLDQDIPHLGIAVADAWCGAGRGRQLMERLIREAKARGKRAISLVYVKQNERAGRLYRSLGFQVTGEQVGADGNDYWQMELRL